MELQRLPISVSTHVARARRVALRLGAGVLSPRELDDLALVVSELGSNLLAHAGSGELLLGVDPQGLEVLALDWGPGIPDIRSSLGDGVTQRVGLGGIGLGAVLRQAAALELWSEAQHGTVVRARLGRPGGPAGYTLAARHRRGCADALRWERTPFGRRVVAVDMAGQGPQVADLARSLAARVLGRLRLDPGRLLLELDRTLREQKQRASAVILDLHDGGELQVAGTADHRIWVDGVPLELPPGTVGIAVRAEVLRGQWRQSVALCSDGCLEVPMQGSDALRAVRALWSAQGRDDSTAAVFSRL